MHKLLLPLLCLGLLLSACGSSDISKESSKTPKGSDSPIVRVVEFADLQCPACKSAHTGVVPPLLAKYGNQISYEFKHFPLRQIHRYALDAAEASECAADQGKFWEYIDMAFENQDKLSTEELTVWAAALELDIPVFERCLNSHRKRDIVLDEYKEGRDMDVSGTPTFFVDGEKVQTGFDTLSSAIEEKVGNVGQRL